MCSAMHIPNSSNHFVNSMKRTLAGILLGATVSMAAQAAGQIVVKSKPGKYADVREDLIMAIGNRGLKVSHVNHISDMLTRTGRAVGDTRRIYGKAEQIEFCKADLSRNMMEADPTNIVFCPFTVSIYTLPGVKGRVFLAYRKPSAPDADLATRRATNAVEHLISEIVQDTIQGPF